MAKIEMDISEYKEMEKNAKLLEEALERERKSQKKYNKLKEQQVQDLKDNSKVVTIINEQRTDEMLLMKRDPREVLHRLGVDSHDFLRRGGHRFLDHACYEISHIQDTFFEKSITRSQPQQTVTRKGLDEVYAQIKEEYAQEMTQKAKNDAQSVIELSAKLQEVKKTYQEKLTELNLAVDRANINFAKAEADLALISEENSEFEELIEAQDLQMENVKLAQEELEKPITVFNALSTLNKIKKLIK